MYDLIIIGAGPAGVSAAIYAKSRGMKVLLLEKNKVGGVIGKVSTVTHYSALIENETGETFANRLKNQLTAAGITVTYEEVQQVRLKGDVKKVITDNGIFEAKAIILANGSTPRKLGIPGEEEFAGNGIGLNAAKDGARYAGKNIYVVGGADGAIKEAIYLAQFAKKLTIIHFEPQLGTIREFIDKLDKLDNVEIRLNTRLTGVYGTDKVSKLELTDIKANQVSLVTDEGCGIFVYAGATPNTELYTELDLLAGYIPVNKKMETEIPGIYAAGDIRVKQVRQVATAVNDGAIAAINAFSYISSK